jgi:hypothetical protein
VFCLIPRPSLSVSPRQLRLHEAMRGGKGGRTGPSPPLAPGKLVAAGVRGGTFALALSCAEGPRRPPAAGLRGDNTGSSTTDFTGLDCPGPGDQEAPGGWVLLALGVARAPRIVARARSKPAPQPRLCLLWRRRGRRSSC